MIRTQISREEREYERAKREARALGISVAEYVRRALHQASSGNGPAGKGPAWMGFAGESGGGLRLDVAGMVESGDSRSSQSTDEVVYGSQD